MLIILKNNFLFKSLNKFVSGEKLTKVNLENLPEYINLNKEKFKNWLED